jgi:uncharacterized protein DUF3300
MGSASLEFLSTRLALAGNWISLFGIIEPTLLLPYVNGRTIEGSQMKLVHHGMTACLCVCLVLGSIPDAFADQTGTFTAQQPPAQAAQLTPEQLQQLVAPIALYPDPLIGQILAAATYPTEIVEGEKWMQEHQGLAGDALAREVDKQQWDPSVKALTQVPPVLANMDQNLAWTSELGDAYVNQQHDLTQWIQTMRQRAMSAGTLKSTPQELVTTEDDTIDIKPASTDLVYVPQYDPWVAYGMPLAPGWFPYPGLYLSSPGFSFGLGVGIRSPPNVVFQRLGHCAALVIVSWDRSNTWTLRP